MKSKDHVKHSLQTSAIGKDYDLNFVYVGKSNPFVKGKIKPILWQKVDDKIFPSNVKPFDWKGYENSRNFQI